MRDEAAAVGLVSRANGSAAGWPPTAWASCRSSCSAASPRGRFASRATPVSSSRCCRSSGRRSGSNRRAATTTSPSTSTRSPSCRRRPTPASPCRSGSPRCSTTSASRYVAWRGSDGRLHYYAKPGVAERSHEQVGADLAAEALRRLRYPGALRTRVTRIVRHHMFQPGRGDPVRARRFLRATATSSRSSSSTTGRRTSSGSARGTCRRGHRAAPAVPGAARARAVSPHRLADLAVDGHDLHRARLPARARTSGACCESCCTTSSTTRRSTPATMLAQRDACEAAPVSEAVPADRLGRARPLPSRVLHARRRRQRRPLRLAEPRHPHRGRSGPGGRESHAALRLRSAPTPTARRWPGSGTARR